MTKCSTCHTPNKTIREFRKLRTKHEELKEKFVAQKQIVSALRKEASALKLEARRMRSSREVQKQRLAKVKSDLSFEKKLSKERKVELTRTQKSLVDTVFSHNRALQDRETRIKVLEERIERFNKALQLIRSV